MFKKSLISFVRLLFSEEARARIKKLMILFTNLNSPEFWHLDLHKAFEQNTIIQRELLAVIKKLSVLDSETTAALASKPSVQTKKPIAYDSLDHLEPLGTRQDNSANLAFNAKLIGLLYPKSVRVLDIGCSGGGFVKTVLDMGHFAVGIEGSDYSQKRKRAEWATIPDYLFTADVTEPFQIESNQKPLCFNVITAWDVLEHISKQGLEQMMKNFDRHLDSDGLIIASISPFESLSGGVNLHVTMEAKDWWIKFFSHSGLKLRTDLTEKFGDTWVRDPDPRGSFNVVFSR